MNETIIKVSYMIIKKIELDNPTLQDGITEILTRLAIGLYFIARKSNVLSITHKYK